jgi:hypothetical protein
MPIAAGLAEICRDVLMDCEPLGNQKLTLFVNPLGAEAADGRRKTYRDTNLWMSSMLPAPEDFVAIGIKCVFLNPNGDVIPISHAIYWTSSVEFYISNRRYWNSVAAEVVDPVLLTNAEEWNKLDFSRRVQIVKRFSSQFIYDGILADRILVPGFPEDRRSSCDQPPVEGILIAAQQHFSVQIDHDGSCPHFRVLCILQGTSWRPIL